MLRNILAAGVLYLCLIPIAHAQEVDAPWVEISGDRTSDRVFEVNFTLASEDEHGKETDTKVLVIPDGQAWRLRGIARHSCLGREHKKSYREYAVRVVGLPNDEVEVNVELKESSISWEERKSVLPSFLRDFLICGESPESPRRKYKQNPNRTGPVRLGMLLKWDFGSCDKHITSFQVNAIIRELAIYEN